jgi:hypothetical protein
MKYALCLLALMLPALAGAQPVEDTLTNTLLSPRQLQEDFHFYARILRETHPGLYRYTLREVMNARLDSIEQTLVAPMKFYEFYKVLASLNASIRCAHSTTVPVADFRSYLNTTKLLPFFILPIEEKLYVLFNGTTDKTIKPGFELTAINGHPVDSISKILKSHFWSDGYIERAKNKVVTGSLFAMFYYSLIERPEQFMLTFKDLQGNKSMFATPAQPFAVIQKSYTKNSVNRTMLSYYNKHPKQGWRLKFLDDPAAVAVLRFDGFGGKGMRTEEAAQKGFQKFMDDALNKIAAKKSKYLVVDVRSNGGGWDVQGVELFTYLMGSDTPVKYYERMHAITDSSEFLRYSDLPAADRQNIKRELRRETDGTFTIREEMNPNLRPQHSKPNRFQGKIYILMNEQSFSTTSEFLALCKFHRVGILVGQECGGAYEGGNGSSFIQTSLPNSKIYISTPLVFYENAVDPVTPQGRGTMPDITVDFTLDDILRHNDRQMETVKDLIRKEEHQIP